MTTYYLEEKYQKGKEVLTHVNMKEAYVHYANCDKPITKEAEVCDLPPQDVSSAHTHRRRKVVVTRESCKCGWMKTLLFNGNQVSVQENGRILEMGGCKGCTTVDMCIMPLLCKAKCREDGEFQIL